jgi:hypothetical protein
MAMQFSYWQPFLKKTGVKGAKNGTFPGRVDFNFSSDFDGIFFIGFLMFHPF